MKAPLLIRIKLMAEYCAFPLWMNHAGRRGELDPGALPLSQEMRDLLERLRDKYQLDPDDLPLSQELVERLERWQQIYEQHLNWDDPSDESYDFTEQERQAFEEEAMQLWSALRQELGPSYEISYYSEPQNRVLTPSDIES